MTITAEGPITSRQSAIVVERCVVVLGLIWISWTLLLPLHSDTPIITFPADDTFYYLQIARNLVQGHGSTFNGIAATNGYHPLWLLVLTAVSAISTRYAFILGFLVAAEITSTVAVFLLARKLFANIAGPGIAASGVALIATSLAAPMLATGMETILAVPLALGTLAYLSEIKEPIGFKQGAILGLLIALTVLSRLDSAILFGLLALAGLTIPSFRKLVTRPCLLGVVVGLAPVAFYLLLNHALFQTWLPISGQAKQLKPIGFSGTLFWEHLTRIKVRSYVLPFAAAAILPLRAKSLSAVQLAIVFAAIAFPFAHCAVLATLSDWPLWDWYAYSVPIACVVAGGWAFRRLAGQRELSWAMLGIGMVLCANARLELEPDIAEGAARISKFAADHPGIYAMGDRSGTVGYVIGQPVVQTEGLVMDNNFLGKIRSQSDLAGVLEGYGVRYYVSSTKRKFKAGPFLAIEPAQSGPLSPTMRSLLTQAPEAEFEIGGWYTRIFDLERSPGIFAGQRGRPAQPNIEGGPTPSTHDNRRRQADHTKPLRHVG